MRVLTLDPQTMSPRKIGPTLMAALAFPALDEKSKMEQAAVAWDQGQILAPPMRFVPAACTIDDYRPTRRREHQGALRTTSRRLRDRMLAAKMARGFVYEAITGAHLRLPLMKRLSINELAKLIQPESGQSDPENIEKRVWGATKPVIHLACAFDLYGFYIQRTPDVPYPLHDLVAHGAVVKLAHWLEDIVLQDSSTGGQTDNVPYVYHHSPDVRSHHAEHLAVHALRCLPIAIFPLSD